MKSGVPWTLLIERARDAVDDATRRLGAAQRRVAVLEEVELPFAPEATRRISLAVSGTQRIGVRGHNGCGKSTLLRVLAGTQAPLAGACRTGVRLTPRRAPSSASLSRSPGTSRKLFISAFRRR